MDLKFVATIKSFFPIGKIWDFQTNFNYLIDGISIEFARLYNNAKDFYNNFNIINSEELADFHAKDYLLDGELYTNKELQRIIVEYINKDFGFKQIIEDFANFINSPIEWRVYGLPVQFGEFEFAETFGNIDNPAIFEVMNLVIILDVSIICSDFKKIDFLVNYLKPPYLNVDYVNKPLISSNYIEFGRSTFPSEFGAIKPC